jgi:hypothetical protein
MQSKTEAAWEALHTWRELHLCGQWLVGKQSRTGGSLLCFVVILPVSYRAASAVQNRHLSLAEERLRNQRLGAGCS